jgi:hypothetical protein
MKKFLIIAAVVFAAYTFANRHDGATLSQAPVSIPEQGSSAKSEANQAPSSVAEQSTGKSDATIANAFANHESNLQVAGEGVVIKLLPDDNNGGRHQRFIIRLPSNQTILIAHNIDLAPGISALREGDSVQFYGEYEWNEKGGIVHWTHRDPNGSHVAGWLEHQGQRYQ